MQRTFLVLMALLGSHDLCLAQERPPSGAGQSFNDEFPTYDKLRWLYSTGWVSGEHSNCTLSARNVSPRPGSVQLSLTYAPNKFREFTCGDLQSRFTYGYGTYEVRMRAAPGAGLLTTFFVYIGPSPEGVRDEIDFMLLGRDTRLAELSYFAGGKNFPVGRVNLDFDTQAMNDYAFEWLPDSLRWFANGELISEVHRKPGEPFPSRPVKIFVSLWNGRGPNMAEWLGEFRDSGAAVSVAVERVAFTEIGEACQFPTSVACRPGANGKKN